MLYFRLTLIFCYILQFLVILHSCILSTFVILQLMYNITPPVELVTHTVHSPHRMCYISELHSRKKCYTFSSHLTNCYTLQKCYISYASQFVHKNRQFKRKNVVFHSSIWGKNVIHLVHICEKMLYIQFTYVKLLYFSSPK